MRRNGNQNRTNYYSSRVYRNNYIYNNTSEAYELYTEPEVYSEPKRHRKRAKKAKELEKSTETMPLGMLKVFVCIGVAFGMTIGFLNVTASNSARQTELLELKENLETINENNAYLETQLNETIDLKRIESIAETRLGMTKPKSYQIKYIDVPKESYTVQYDTDSETHIGFMDIVRNLFKG